MYVIPVGRGHFSSWPSCFAALCQQTNVHHAVWMVLDPHRSLNFPMVCPWGRRIDQRVSKVTEMESEKMRSSPNKGEHYYIIKKSHNIIMLFIDIVKGVKYVNICTNIFTLCDATGHSCPVPLKLIMLWVHLSACNVNHFQETVNRDTQGQPRVASLPPPRNHPHSH